MSHASLFPDICGYHPVLSSGFVLNDFRWALCLRDSSLA